MTRFARARGSKACNQKIPDEATKWKDMKISNSTSPELKPASSSVKKTGERKGKKFPIKNTKVWAEIPPEKESESENELEEEESDNEEVEQSGEELAEDEGSQVEEESDDQAGFGDEIESDDEDESSDEVGSGVVGESEEEGEDESGDDAPLEVGSKTRLPSTNEVPRKQKGNKRKSDEAGNILSKKQKTFGPLKLARAGTSLNTKQNKVTGTVKGEKEEGQKVANFGKRRLPELMGNANMEQSVTGLVGNKKRRFMGCRIREEEMGEIMDLKNEMESKGASEDKIRMAVKNKCRQSEKKGKKSKLKICFMCRESGHFISDCPKKGEVGPGETGICFKCGSTEHKAAHCAKRGGPGFKFAKCFKCSKEGHIARECPDNPNGIFPYGGSCRSCGSVNHFQRDCPKFQKKKEEDGRSKRCGFGTPKGAVDSLDDGEDNDSSLKARPKPLHRKRPRKVVKM